MAIKINLLPQSYALERVRNRWLAGMAALLGLTGLSIGLLYLSDQKELEKWKADVTTITQIAQQTTAAEAARDAALGAAAPVKGVVDFMTDASRSGPERAALLDLVRRYIYREAIVSDLDLSSGVDAKITATVRTPDEYARFLLALRQGAIGTVGGVTGAGKLFQSDPVASGVPGFPEGRPLPTIDVTETPVPLIYPFRISAQGPLKTDANPRNTLLYVPPEPPGTAAAGGAGAAGAPGGAPGGSSSGYSGSSSSGAPGTSASPSASPSSSSSQ